MIVLVLKMLEKLTGAYTKDPDSLIGKLFQLFASALWGVEDTLQVIAVCTPPTWCSASNTVTSYPIRASSPAQVSPAGPEPMTASIA